MDLVDEDTPPNPLKSFDAFPKVHQSYIHSRSSKGGIVSIALLFVVTILFWTEMMTWWRGTEVMRVSVEKGVGHGMQLNVDITVAMACEGSPLINRINCRCGGQCSGCYGRQNPCRRGTH
jgi:hypothetical protein